MSITLDRPTTLPAAVVAEQSLHDRVTAADTLVLREWRRTHLQDLIDLRVLCEPGTWPDLAWTLAHEVVVIDAELDRRGECPGPRPACKRVWA